MRTKRLNSRYHNTYLYINNVDLAPPTRFLMDWKKTVGAEKLLALPGRKLHNQEIFKNFQANLTVKHTDAEKVTNSSLI